MRWPGKINASPLASFWRIDLAGIAICAVVTVAGYWLGVRPLVSGQQEISEQRALFAKQKVTAAALAANTRAMRTQLSSDQLNLAAVEVDLQPISTLNSRIDGVATLASTCHLEVQTIQPGTLTTYPRFGVLPMQLSGTGNYRAYADFLHHLRDRFPDMGVRAFQMNANPVDPSAMNSFSFDLTWHVQSSNAK